MRRPKRPKRKRAKGQVTDLDSAGEVQLKIVASTLAMFSSSHQGNWVVGALPGLDIQVRGSDIADALRKMADEVDAFVAKAKERGN